MNLKKQLKLKIKLEEKFRPEVKRLFQKINAEFRIGISTGTFIRAYRYKSQLETILDNHYGRVQNAFMGVVKTDTKQDEENLNDAVLAALLMWGERTGTVVTDEMLNTTQNNMDDAVTQARQSFANEGNYSFTTRELAVVSATILSRKFKGRENTIIISETQKASESTKLIEAYAEAGMEPRDALVAGAVGAVLAKKEWWDVGDHLVRRGHRHSDVASVPINQPFLVNGQFLMFPGDMSMGALIGNVAGCRCGSKYTF